MESETWMPDAAVMRALWHTADEDCGQPRIVTEALRGVGPLMSSDTRAVAAVTIKLGGDLGAGTIPPNLFFDLPDGTDADHVAAVALDAIADALGGSE